MSSDGWTWQPDDPPHATEVDLSLAASIHLSGMQTAMHRPPKIDAASTSLAVAPPRAVSVPIASPRIPVRSFSFFSESSCLPAEPDSKPAQPSSVEPPPSALKSQTHIAAPGDLIKLEDRLFYALQPPLETLAASHRLAFPFTPFPFQMTGIAFLYPRYAAILADEMGLGKTMQAITAIRLLLHAGQLRSVLLICPKPLVTNWSREFALWAPEVPVTVVEGNRERREWQWRLPDAPLKIANYELLLRDGDILESPDLHFDLVVLDEAQRIKNRSSTTSQVARGISRSRNWALTGTPVENSTEDLVGIFEFLSPGHLSSDMTARRMGRETRDYTLRRTKDVVMKDLPKKLYRDAELDLTTPQQIAYEMAEDEGVVHLTELGESLSIQHVFELVLRLKQICNFDPATGSSSKLERLEADLEEVAASGQKAIVFSQWVQTLTHLSDKLRRFKPLEYHGKIPTGRRDEVIQQFKTEPDRHVILMSYGAGAVGLNLQFCHYVFLFDRWWNPAVEDQAINRAHRIGVTGPVTVSRYLTLGTIEERIDQVLRDKRELFDTIFSQTDSPRNLGMTQGEIFGLFNLTSPKGPLNTRAA